MKIKNAYLVASEIFYFDKNMIRTHFPLKQKGESLGVINKDNVILSSYYLMDYEFEAPQFWRDLIDKCCIRTDYIFEYSILDMFFRLKIENLGKIFSEDQNPYNLSISINELFNSIFNKFENFRIPPTDETQDIPFIIFIEPEIDEDINDHSLYNFTKEIKNYFNNESLAVPFTFNNVIVLSGLGYLGTNLGGTVVSIQKFDQEEYSDFILISKPVISLNEYFKYIRILKLLLEKAKNIEFNRYDFTSYVKALKESKNLLLDYENKYLQDVQELIKEIPKIQNQHRQIYDKLNLNEFYSSYINKNILELTEVFENINPKFPYVIKYLYKIINESDILHGEIENTITETLNNKKMFTEHFQDIISINVNLSNLKLQKSIKLLTIITVFITLMAVIIALIPDMEKNYIYHIFTNWFIQLFK